MKTDPSREYIKMICRFYGDVYDDREEDSRFGGDDWQPGIKAQHRSLSSFQKDLEENYGIKLSRSKVQKILITGGCWTTERSREIQEMYEGYIRSVDDGGKGLTPKNAINRIAQELEISTVAVNINLPYEKVVYGLEGKSKNAMRIERYRRRK